MNDEKPRTNKGPVIATEFKPAVGADVESQPPLSPTASAEEVRQRAQSVFDEEAQKRLGLADAPLATVQWSGRYTQSENAHWTELDGEAVLLNLDNGNYYTLNRVGTVMWELLTSDHTPEQVLAAIRDRFDVTEETARRDLAKLVTHLSHEQLLAEK